MFIQENAFENVVWKMAAILYRPQWVKGYNCIFQGPNELKMSCVENIGHFAQVTMYQAVAIPLSDGPI